MITTDTESWLLFLRGVASSATERTLGSKKVQLAWLEKNHHDIYNKAKSLETFLSIADVKIDGFNKDLNIVGFKEETRNLLVLFYDDARKFYYNQMSTNPKITTAAYLRLLEQKLQQITRQADIIKFYLNSQYKFESAFVKQNPFEYMKTVIKIKSAIYFASPRVEQKERDIIDKFIQTLTAQTADDSRANTVDLMTELFNLIHKRELSERIKKDLIQPCIDQSSAVYGAYPLQLMTRLRDFSAGVPRRGSKTISTIEACTQSRLRPRSRSM